MRKFYYTCSSMEKSGDNRANGTSRVDAMEIGYLLKSLQQLVLASPLYGIYQNPDFGAELPARLPLMAFDHQSLTEKLDLAAAERVMQTISPTTELIDPDMEEDDAPDDETA
jgi:hypothetical protein